MQLPETCCFIIIKTRLIDAPNDFISDGNLDIRLLLLALLFSSYDYFILTFFVSSLYSSFEVA